jgi:hypothetical protein
MSAASVHDSAIDASAAPQIPSTEGDRSEHQSARETTGATRAAPPTRNGRPTGGQEFIVHSRPFAPGEQVCPAAQSALEAHLSDGVWQAKDVYGQAF